MPRKTNKNGIAAQRLKAIRPYVNFNYNLRDKLSASAKRKIATYYKEIGELKARPFQAYRPRDPAKLKAAQEFAQHTKRLPGLTTAFIPTNGTDKLKISVNKKGVVTISTDHVITHGLRFNLEQLAADPETEVARVIADDDSTHYAVRAGKYEIPTTATRPLISTQVQRLMLKYSEGGDSYQRPGHKNNDWTNWLHGLNGYKFKNQAEPAQYMQSKLDAKRKHQKKNKKMREDGRAG